MPTAPRTPQRRTHRERRETTRAALLDATLSCLIDYGYSGVTTNRVVERAGVSRGAQVYHFPTKAQLVAEAVRHLAARRLHELAADVAALPQTTRRVDAVLDVLWSAHSGPLFQAALELWIAARTEPELLTELKQVERDVNTKVRDSAAELFGEEAAAQPDFMKSIELALSAMRGSALMIAVQGDPQGTVEERWSQMRGQLRQLFNS